MTLTDSIDSIDLGSLSEPGIGWLTPPTTVGIVLLDDHEVVRQGLRQLIEPEPDLAVMGEAATAAEAVDLVTELAPALALLDVVLPDGSGVEVCREIRMRTPEVRCVLLTAHRDTRTLLSATLAGASACVTKDITGSTLLEVLRRVAAGDCLLDPTWTMQVVERLRADHHPDPALARLTHKQREILALVATGLTNRQIAERLQLSERTVKNHVSELLTRLGVQRRTQAAVLHADIERRNVRWP